MTNKSQKNTVRREYLRRLKQAFDKAGIEIPFPHMTIHTSKNTSDEAKAVFGVPAQTDKSD